MNRRLDARVARLETLLANHADSDPCSIWRACWELGHDLPYPVPGQSCADWLRMVPSDALHELMGDREGANS